MGQSGGDVAVGSPNLQEERTQEKHEHKNSEISKENESCTLNRFRFTFT